MRLIDERELIRRISELPDLRTMNTATIGKIIKECSTIDAEPVRHGEWIENGPGWVCSYCGTEFKDELEFIEGAGDYYMPHYCPHCGAKMDLEVVEHETD